MSLRKKIFILVSLALAGISVIIFYATFILIIPDEYLQQVNIFKQEEVRSALIITFISILGIGSLAAIFLEKVFMSPLDSLCNNISRIGVNGDFTSRIEVEGKEGLSSLTAEMNGMLLALEWSHYEMLESEARLRRITDNMIDMIVQTDVKGIMEYVSPSHESILGYKPGEMIGKNLLDFIHHKDQKKLEEALLKAQETFTLDKIEFRCKNKKGYYIWLESVGNLLYDNKGSISGAIFGSRDVTERKMSEKALRESEEKHRQIMESVEEGYYEVNLKGNFIFFNNSLCRITGYSRKELQELNFKKLSPNYNEISKVFNKVSMTGRPEKSLTLPLIKKDGRENFMEISITLITDNHGKHIGFRGLLRDVTERKLAENEIKKMNEELERRVKERTAQLEAANKELEAFSYSVSHDLRAPLRSIDGFSSALVEDYGDCLDNQGKDYLQRVRTASQRMAQLIDDLLNLSRVSRSEICKEKVNLSNMAQEIMAEFQQDEPEKNVKFNYTSDLVVEGDMRLLRIMMENILGNAWKFTSKNLSATIEFGLHTKEKNGKSVFYIRDDGAGFDMAYANKLFGPFQRLHSPEEFSGTGIGLATVARIINRHGGKVWAEGELEKGSTFYFSL